MKVEAIEISGFKNLIDLEISNLKKINYIIGSSGAGKSSIWELLAILTRGQYRNEVNQFGNLKHVIADKLNVRLALNDGQNLGRWIYECSTQGGSYLKVDTRQEGYALPQPDIQIFSSEVKEHGYSVGKHKTAEIYNPAKYNGPVESALYEIAERYPESTLTEVSHITRGNNEDEPTILRGPRRNEEMSAANLAGGYAALTSLAAAIQYNLGSIIVIEEPENGMHVSLQKTLHKLFKDLTSGNDSVQLIVITHSPFLLGSVDASDTETNTYLISKGAALKQNGYDAKGARYLASRLVGVTLEDIAPLKIVVCEGSLAALLNKVNDRFYSSSIMITSAKSHMGGEASGDEDILTLAEVEDVYKNRFNFFSKSDLIFIIDQLNQDQAKQRKRVDALLAKDTELTELSKTKLEDYYPEVQGLEEDDNTYIMNHENSKKKRAERLGEKISKNEFERVFPEIVSVFTA